MSHKTLIAANILLTVAFVGVVSAFAQTTDTTAPIISGIGASGITQTAATVDWTTDEPADSQVEYGTTTAYGVLSPLASATTTAHHVSLGSLTASTVYHYRVMSKDVVGNLATSTDNIFTTLADTTAPTISGVAASGISDTAATIDWNTDELADGQVIYGTSTAYGFSSALVAAPAMMHHIALGSLASSTTYHFVVKSKDASGNAATSSDYTFTTLAAPVVPAPADVSVKFSVEPRVLNAMSKGKWIEAEVKFPKGTDPRTIDTTSVRLNGTLAPVRVSVNKVKWYEMFGAFKAPKMELKFARQDVVALLTSAASTASLTASSTPVSFGLTVVPKDLTISGTAGGKTFAGTTTIRVLTPGSMTQTIAPFMKKEEKREEKKEGKQEERSEGEHRFSQAAITASSTQATTTTSFMPPVQEKEQKSKKFEREMKQEMKKAEKEMKKEEKNERRDH